MTPSPALPPDDGQQHPLDEREAREFERIVRGFRRTAHPRPVDPGARPLRWSTVVLVLAAASSFALASSLLPSPANLWTPVGALVAVALGSLAWALRATWRRPECGPF